MKKEGGGDGGCLDSSQHGRVMSMRRYERPRRTLLKVAKNKKGITTALF